MCAGVWVHFTKLFAKINFRERERERHVRKRKYALLTKYKQKKHNNISEFDLLRVVVISDYDLVNQTFSMRYANNR